MLCPCCLLCAGEELLSLSGDADERIAFANSKISFEAPFGLQPFVNIKQESNL
jgi:hypothetical protein